MAKPWGVYISKSTAINLTLCLQTWKCIILDDSFCHSTDLCPIWKLSYTNLILRKNGINCICLTDCTEIIRLMLLSMWDKAISWDDWKSINFDTCVYTWLWCTGKETWSVSVTVTVTYDIVYTDRSTLHAMWLLKCGQNCHSKRFTE